MTRRLLNILTVLSLVLFLAVAVVWVRSYWVWEVHMFQKDQPLLGELPAGPIYYQLESARGTVSVIAIHASRFRRPVSWLLGDGGIVPAGKFTVAVSEESRYGPILVGSGTAVTYTRAGVSRSFVGQSVPFRTVSVPYWVFAAVFGAPPAFWLARAADKRRRRAAGLCRVCGYDIRATPDRCPECGTPSSSHQA